MINSEASLCEQHVSVVAGRWFELLFFIIQGHGTNLRGPQIILGRGKKE